MSAVPRTFDGARILQAGPLTMRGFAAALGVPVEKAASTLTSMIRTGIVERTTIQGEKRYGYRLVP